MNEVNDLTTSGVAARAKAIAYIRDRLVSELPRQVVEDALVGLDLGDGSDEALDRIVSRILLREMKRRLVTERAAEDNRLVELDKRLIEGAGDPLAELDRRRSRTT